MEQYADYGFEVGGPLIEDRLWAWGSLGETDIRLRTLIDTADRTTLTNRALKVQGQVTTGCGSASTISTARRSSWGGTPGRRDRTRPPGTRVAWARACTPARPTGRERPGRQRQRQHLQQRFLSDAPRRIRRGRRLSRREPRLAQLLRRLPVVSPAAGGQRRRQLFPRGPRAQARLRLAEERVESSLLGQRGYTLHLGSYPDNGRCCPSFSATPWSTPKAGT